MSTTVSYKGQTLTTVSNDTKTLLTEGKYLEDDLTLTDVSGGGAVLTTKNISTNGTYNASSDSADGYSQVTVAVPASAVDTGTKSITANGTHDVIGYASANVNVPNSYSASDEGRVVSSGALVAQTAHADVTPTTSDQTIDTTTNDSIKVKGDADLVASNIKKDVEIFGVTGSYEGGGGGVSLDEVATASLSGTLVLTEATKIEVNAFFGNTGITSASSDTVQTIMGGAFRECTGLTSISFPNCTTFSGNGGVLYSASALTDVYLPKLSSPLPNYAFRDCASLVNLALPRGTSVYTQVFCECSNLEALDFGGEGGLLAAQALKDAPKLNKLILRSSSLKTLANTNAFDNTPFANGKAGGTLYVPSALVSSYQSATNWSTVLGYTNNQILPIEGSYYETHYADGTPISA